MNGRLSREFVDNISARAGADPHRQDVRVDAKIMLVDDPVKRVDNMAMASGLETRVPFLDHEVVELAARIPAESRCARGQTYSQGSLARPRAGRGHRSAKGYFPVPALKYIRGPYLRIRPRRSRSPPAWQRGLFNVAMSTGCLADPEAELTPKGHSKLWQLALLECWLQTQGI